MNAKGNKSIFLSGWYRINRGWSPASPLRYLLYALLMIVAHGFFYLIIGSYTLLPFLADIPILLYFETRPVHSKFVPKKSYEWFRIRNWSRSFTATVYLMDILWGTLVHTVIFAFLWYQMGSGASGLLVTADVDLSTPPLSTVLLEFILLQLTLRLILAMYHHVKSSTRIPKTFRNYLNGFAPRPGSWSLCLIFHFGILFLLCFLPLYLYLNTELLVLHLLPPALYAIILFNLIRSSEILPPASRWATGAPEWKSEKDTQRTTIESLPRSPRWAVVWDMLGTRRKTWLLLQLTLLLSLLFLDVYLCTRASEPSLVPTIFGSLIAMALFGFAISHGKKWHGSNLSYFSVYRLSRARSDWLLSRGLSPSFLIRLEVFEFLIGFFVALLGIILYVLMGFPIITLGLMWVLLYPLPIAERFAPNRVIGVTWKLLLLLCSISIPILPNIFPHDQAYLFSFLLIPYLLTVAIPLSLSGNNERCKRLLIENSPETYGEGKSTLKWI